jgi:hypothetical protein
MMPTVKEIGKQALSFVEEVEMIEVDRVQLNTLLYTFNEARLWSDDWEIVVTPEQALLCWRIVERLNGLSELPEDVML